MAGQPPHHQLRFEVQTLASLPPSLSPASLPLHGQSATPLLGPHHQHLCAGYADETASSREHKERGPGLCVRDLRLAGPDDDDLCPDESPGVKDDPLIRVATRVTE